MNQSDTGLLLNAEDIKLHRGYFAELTQLIGVKPIFRKPKNKQYDKYGDLDSNYEEGVRVGCIFEEHPNQYTMKKLGWNSELSEELSIIHVPYDLPVERGALFIIPSGLDNAQGRVFKVLEMSTISIYPASVVCKLGPFMQTTSERSVIDDHHNSDFNILIDDSEEERD